MKTKLVAFIVATWATASYANYPTVWNFENPGPTPVTVICEMPKPYGLSSPIRLFQQVIKPGETAEYCWSNYWYNDGLGLNPGTWRCTYNGAQIDYGFNTTWGEDILLNVVTGVKKTLPSSAADNCY